MYTWIILFIISLVLLVKYWGSRNAVWGGLTLGIIIGLIWKFVGRADWYILIKVATVGILLGFGAELLGMLFDRLKKKN